MKKRRNLEAQAVLMTKESRRVRVCNGRGCRKHTTRGVFINIEDVDVVLKLWLCPDHLEDLFPIGPVGAAMFAGQEEE